MYLKPLLCSALILKNGRKKEEEDEEDKKKKVNEWMIEGDGARRFQQKK